MSGPLSVQQILNRVFRTADGGSLAAVESAQAVLNVVFDAEQNALRVALEGGGETGGETGGTLEAPAIRAAFGWNSASRITIGPGRYWHAGSTEQFVYWTGALTKDLTGAAANTWYYVYIDDSAIVSAGTNILTATEFTWSTTAPTKNAEKGGRYNGDDLFVFAVRTDGSGDIIEFWHGGGAKVHVAEPIADLTTTDIDLVWTDVTLTAPDFGEGTRVLVWAYKTNHTANPNFLWRKNGSTTSGLPLVTVSLEAKGDEIEVVTDADLKIEVVSSLNTADQLNVKTIGYFLPEGA